MQTTKKTSCLNFEAGEPINQALQDFPQRKKPKKFLWPFIRLVRTMKSKKKIRIPNFFFSIREKNKKNNFSLYSSNQESPQMFKPRSFATAECLEFRKENDLDYGKFYLSGLKKGQGLTVANSIRRILLYDLQGIGITHVKVSAKNSTKVYHEFATIPGIRESILDLLMNLRLVVWGLKSESKKTISPPADRNASISKYYKGELFLQNILESSSSFSTTLKTEPQSEKNESRSEKNREKTLKSSLEPEVGVTLSLVDQNENKKQTQEIQKTFILRAKHLNIPQNSGLFIVNPEQYLATIVFSLKQDISLSNKAHASRSSAEPLFPTEALNQLNELNSIKIEYVISNLVNKVLTPSEGSSPQADFLLTDGNFFPIKKVNYSIQENQQGERSLRHQESLTDENVFLEIWTNGSFHPKEALSQALDYFLILFQELKTSLVSF